jgi:hypothetical protein
MSLRVGKLWHHNGKGMFFIFYIVICNHRLNFIMNWAEIYVQIVFLLNALYIEEQLSIPPHRTLQFPNSQLQPCSPVPLVYITTCCILFLHPFCLHFPVWSRGFIFTLFSLYFFNFFMSFYPILRIWHSDFMSLFCLFSYIYQPTSA